MYLCNLANLERNEEALLDYPPPTENITGTLSSIVGSSGINMHIFTDLGKLFAHCFVIMSIFFFFINAIGKSLS